MVYITAFNPVALTVVNSPAVDFSKIYYGEVLKKSISDQHVIDFLGSFPGQDTTHREYSLWKSSDHKNLYLEAKVFASSYNDEPAGMKLWKIQVNKEQRTVKLSPYSYGNMDDVRKTSKVVATSN